MPKSSTPRPSTRTFTVLALAGLSGAVIAAMDRTAPMIPMAVGGNVAAATAVAANKTSSWASKSLLVGDADLQGEIALGRMKQVGDHFEVPLRGSDGRAVLTLDPELQMAAETVLKRAKAPRGAIVAMSPDGRILAFAGRYTNGTSAGGDYSLPARTWAPAASIFKIVTAGALVDAGVNPHDSICYHGGVRSVVASNLRDHANDSECNDLRYGLAKSQNALVAKLFHRHLDRARLAKAARAFGFDRAAQFALAAESNRFSLPADELELARVAAGFWSTELSPLGGAEIANIIASAGNRVTPRIVARVDREGATIPVVAAAPERVISAKTAQRVNEMMVATIDYGTAQKAFHDPRGKPYLPGVSVAGKTGSLAQGGPDTLSYSWFIGFAPAKDPKIVISVLLGNSPLWHLKAHTAARLVLQEAL